MRLNRLFIGKYEPIRRPANAVDDALMRRVHKARQELTARGKDIVPVRENAQIDGRETLRRAPRVYDSGNATGVVHALALHLRQQL
jgi:hypothetical protein